MFLAAALTLHVATGLAQDGDLASVTMRVLDDVSAIDAAIIELDANSSEGGEAAEAGADAATESDRAADGRDAAAEDDNDVEPPAVPPAAVP
jgi:hypothetical protein